MYADENDFRLIFQRLDSDPEVAIIVPNGTKKWIAKSQVGHLEDGRYYLWHVPSGKLPLYKEGKVDILGKRLRTLLNVAGLPLVEADWIEDPWAAWKGPCITTDPNVPFFGGIPGVIELKLQTKGIDFSNFIGLSAFGWIANRYRPVGKPAKKETENWWQRLRKWVAKVAVGKVPRIGPLDGPNPEIWAFPSAYSRIATGVPRDMNPP
jgi:hypothetical protein